MKISKVEQREDFSRNYRKSRERQRNTANVINVTTYGKKKEKKANAMENYVWKPHQHSLLATE